MKKYLFFLFIFCLYLGANYYIFNHFRILFSTPAASVVFYTAAVCLSVSVIVFYSCYKFLPVRVASVLYRLGTGWLIIIIYPFVLFLILDLPTVIFPESSVSFWGTWGIAGFTVLLCGYGYSNYKKKKRIYLSLFVKKELKRSLKIVALSDMHLGYAISKKELKGWIQKINEENPDIVLIAGDIVDNSTLPLNHYKLYEYFKEIKAPLGIYTCLGNHEYLSGVEESMKFIQDAGITLVKDSSVLVEDSFYIVGRDDRTNPGRKPLSELLTGLDTGKPVIVLDHQPYHLEEAEQNQVDLQFSGHTHHGQIWPFSLLTDLIYEKSHGYIKKGNTHIYVSSGIGIWGGRLRIGTHSEYVVIELQSE